MRRAPVAKDILTGRRVWAHNPMEALLFQPDESLLHGRLWRLLE